LYEPWECASKEGRPYKAFAPFFRTVLARRIPDPIPPIPRHLTPAPSVLSGLTSDDLGWTPDHLPAGFTSTWDPSRHGAQTLLQTFLDHSVDGYARARDFPAVEEGTSRLSPYLRWGQIGPREV